MIGVTSLFHFSTIRENIFLWVEECLVSTSDIGFRLAS